MPSRLPLRPLALLAALLLPAAAGSAQSAESLVVREAIAEFQRTGRARVLEVGQTILVPYGQVDPVLKTALLRTTLIELGRNEWVVDRFMGDTLRWDVAFGAVGTEDSYRQIVSVKPTDQDLTTSLVLTMSSGRIYQFTLDSEPYPAIERTQNPTDIPYTAHVKFYYPEEGSVDGLVSLAGGFGAGGFGAGAAGPAGAASGFVDPNGLALNTAHYVIEADPGFPCAPISAGDNGTHLRLHFPDHTQDLACAQRFPLYAVGETGELQLLNYAVEGGNTYVADRVPAEARVLYRTGTGEVRQVSIRNTSMHREPQLAGVVVGLGVGAALPASSSPFRQTYAPGLDLAGSVGLRATRALTLGVEVGVQSLGANGAFLDDAVEFGLNDALAPTLAARLAADGAIAPGESVVLFSRGAQSDVRTLRLSALGRLSLRPGGRVEPYLGARVGVLRRTATAASYRTTGLVIGVDGSRRSNAALDAQIDRSFAGANGSDGPEAQAFAARLRGEYGSEYDLPSWLVGESDAEMALDLGASFGLAVRATRSVQVYAEGEYAYTPLGARPDRAVLPIHLGVRAGF